MPRLVNTRARIDDWKKELEKAETAIKRHELSLLRAHNRRTTALTVLSLLADDEQKEKEDVTQQALHRWPGQ